MKCVEINLLWQIDEIDELRTFLSQSNNRRWWILPFEKQKNTSNIGTGSGSGNKKYSNIQNKIYQLFKDGLLEIQPSQWGPLYNLKKLGYDVCEKVTSFRYFKSDLLLYRSSSKDKGYISICIRGRNRNEGSEIPKGWKIIDIIVSSVPDLNKTDYHVLRSNPNTLFHNFKYKPNQQSDSNLLEAKPVPVLSTEEENKYREESTKNYDNYLDIKEEENIEKNREMPKLQTPFSSLKHTKYSDKLDDIDKYYESNKFKRFGYNNELEYNYESDNLEDLGYFNEMDKDESYQQMLREKQQRQKQIEEQLKQQAEQRKLFNESRYQYPFKQQHFGYERSLNEFETIECITPKQRNYDLNTYNNTSDVYDDDRTCFMCDCNLDTKNGYAYCGAWKRLNVPRKTPPETAKTCRFFKLKEK